MTDGEQPSETEVEVPVSAPPDLFERQKMRFDYAWKWFEFHAEQRTKMFNFMLLGFGIFATAIVGAIDKNLLFAALLLSFAAVLVALAFIQIDIRNRYLYRLAHEVLAGDEANGEFGPGVNMATTVKGEDADKLLAGLRKGKHKYYMPFVASIFLVLFVIMMFYSIWLIAAHPAPSGTPLVCCQTSGSGGVNSGVDTIEQVPPPLPDTQEHPRTAPWLLVVSGIAFLCLGALVFALGHKVIGSLLLALGAATSVLPHVTIPLTAKFSLNPKFDVEFKAEMKNEWKVEFDKLLGVIRRSEPALLASSEFSGFGEGDELLNCDDPQNQQKVSTIHTGMDIANQRHLQLVMLLVGGTDRKPLSAALRRRYESNAGLARARVNAVETCLVRSMPSGSSAAGVDKPPKVIRLITGPGYTPGTKDPAEVALAKMSDDRGVSAYILGLPVTEHLSK